MIKINISISGRGGVGEGRGGVFRPVTFLSKCFVRKGIILNIKLQLGNHAYSLISVKRTIVTDQINR